LFNAAKHSGLTRGLTQGGNVAERGPLASVAARLPTLRKKLRNDESGSMWMAILNPKSLENTPKNAKKRNISEARARFLHLTSREGDSPLCPRQLRHW